MEQWKVLKRDHLPAYITWDRYLANQERLRQHRSLPGSQGTPRNGAALLAGLVICGNCGRRLQASYRTRQSAYYDCIRHRQEGTEQTCHGLKAAVVDELVTRQVLRALEPAALELSCQAMETIERDRARLDKHWKQRLEQAGHEAKDAERRYRAVDPENRLVARTLEQRWEDALRAERCTYDHDRFCANSHRGLVQRNANRQRWLDPPLPCGMPPTRPSKTARRSSGIW